MPRYETALVTGGTTGIGLALTRQLCAEGTKVAVCARNTARLEEVKDELGDMVITIAADVSDPKRAEAVVHEAIETLGSLDLLIANAGMGRNAPAKQIVVDHIVDTLKLNMLGACATVVAAVPHMVERGRGQLVGITSVAANRGLPTSAAYCASKAGFSVFLESLRTELNGLGVRVTEIRPGFIDTPLTKKNRFKMPWLMGPERAARKILAAVAKRKKVYTFPWQMAFVARLMRWLPDWLYDAIMGKAPL